MHNLDSLLNAAQDAEPRPGLLAAARRYDPWLIALIVTLQAAVITAALAWLSHHEPTPPTPATSQQET